MVPGVRWLHFFTKRAALRWTFSIDWMFFFVCGSHTEHAYSKWGLIDKYMMRIQVTHNMMEDNMCHNPTCHRSRWYWFVVASVFNSLPFLNTGDTLAHFLSPVTWPVVNDWLNINFRNGAIFSAASVKSLPNTTFEVKRKINTPNIKLDNTLKLTNKQKYKGLS